MTYLTELQAVSLQPPPENELVPGFYREMKMFSHRKAWLRIGDQTGFQLDEHPVVEATNRHYAWMEEEVPRQGAKSLPGISSWIKEAKRLSDRTNVTGKI